MTVRKLASLVNLDDESVKGLLGQMRELDPENAKQGLNAVMPLDPSDKTPITAEERKVFDYPEKFATRADIARESIMYLLNESTWFRDTVAQTIQDVSYFQDKDWEEQLKN
jgi:hypothetical protein